MWRGRYDQRTNERRPGWNRGRVGETADRKDDVPPQLSSRPAEGEAAFRAVHERKPLMLSHDERILRGRNLLALLRLPDYARSLKRVALPSP